MKVNGEQLGLKTSSVNEAVVCALALMLHADLRHSWMDKFKVAELRYCMGLKASSVDILFFFIQFCKEQGCMNS